LKNEFFAQNLLDHLWSSAHVILAHFPIALLSVMFFIGLSVPIVRILNSKLKSSLLDNVNWSSFYKSAFIMQVFGTILIFPTKLFGERDYDALGSEKLKDLAEKHEEYGELVTNFYLLFLVATVAAILYRRILHKPIESNNPILGSLNKIVVKIDQSVLSRFINKFVVHKPVLRTWWWLGLSAVGFGLLSYVGYLGGVLVHEYGILTG